MACDLPPGAPNTDRAETDTGRGPREAWITHATDRYPHGALGDPVEAGGIAVHTRRGRADGLCPIVVELPPNRVFEDAMPRIADLDGDGRNEVVVVESDAGKGARLTAWGLRGARLKRIASTPWIGRPNRWLAPVGIADLTGDGRLEVAYVETPHLGKTLRLVALRNGRFVELASASNLTNHRFGEPWMDGGIRDCFDDAPAKIVTANGDWT
ncbi:FG-GAP repeat domain-containing protein [Amaricoccus tamworthensis]|uniref:FG-GAP repeat domain-containing protein n=1 Tax=Amaricoccus tamworthensis TaxID=57002 RepID=UPI003C7A37F6